MEALNQMVTMQVIDRDFGVFVSLFSPPSVSEGMTQPLKGPHTSFAELPLFSSAHERSWPHLPDSLTLWSTLPALLYRALSSHSWCPQQPCEVGSYQAEAADL